MSVIVVGDIDVAEMEKNCFHSIKTQQMKNQERYLMFDVES
jgi:hypothetical protein